MTAPTEATRRDVARAGPGLLAAALAVVVAGAVHRVVPQLPALTVAVVLGILTANLPQTARLVAGALGPGLAVASKRLMRLGIVLLGLRLSLGEVAELGWRTLAVVVGIVLVTFVGTLLAGRVLGLPRHESLLVATGFSICGASAIAAMGAVTGASRRTTVVPTALVTLCGTLAIAVLPLLQGPLGLAPEAFGRWVGASVHDVGQVVATAGTAGTAALAAAVVVKLTRVLMLAPMVAGVALTIRARRGADDERPLPPVVPLFVAGFLGMIALRSTGAVPTGVLEAAALAQDLLLTAALFGLGSAVRAGELLRTGGRPLVLALVSWALVATVSLVALGLS
ncbi:YeiH family protein [Georgenia muralis]|uniref:Putative integral membrane protein (TIGR00698 family) n=1 Tax=Georgenia muralis TaxID=154117 RepID=A0A3N5A4T7_9MICO|nr:putative sulfate exporter family transporter [Georgenia muralis]RPF26801.1 putative integral membrane protein (TIGR00698 family) [Georgenia muralis]